MKKFEGSRYQKHGNTNIKDIAKIIRGELKGKYPECKFSVTIERYSGGQALNIDLMSGNFKAILKQGRIEENFKFISAEELGYDEKGYVQLNQYSFSDGYDYEVAGIKGWTNGAQLSKEAWDVMSDACDIASSFNFDDSDSMTDYFHVNFYLHMNIGKFDKPYIQID